MQLTKSEELYKRAVASIPGGVNSNSRFRNPHPVYYQKGEGAYLTDVDGNRYIDCIMGNGSIILGHNDQEFNERVQYYSTSGIVTGVETELSIKTAEKFLSLVPTAEQIRYTNTGTEAIMHAMAMARTYTGKSDIAVIEGAYNGWHDAVHVSIWPDLQKAGDKTEPKSLPGTSGLIEGVVKSTLVLPYNDLETAERLLTKNKHRIAALIIEPTMIDIGYIPAKKEYLQGLRKLCDQLNIVLVFDELLTGFRDSPGGAQEYYGLTPDLSTFGKAISNGYMLAAIAGKSVIFETVTPGKGTCSFVGTYNGHQLSLAASLAFMEIYEERKVFQSLQTKTEKLITEFAKIAENHQVKARVQGRGGHFHWYFTDQEIVDYRSATQSNKEHYGEFIETLAGKGVYCSPNYLLHHAISMAHTDEIIQQLVDYMDVSLKQITGIKTGL